MRPFKAPVEDILFSLNHVAGAGELDHWDPDLARGIAEHFAVFAEAEIAPLDEPGDREGCRLENGRVVMPRGFDRVFRAYVEQGWPGLTAPEAFGGQGMGAPILGIVTEIFTAACHSLQMVTGLVPGAIRTLLHFGTDDQKGRLIPPLARGDWLATMCLTEPGTGSDLSRIRCRALRDGDSWRIEGEKIFISGGDQDLSDGILHLVLTRTSDQGLKGLSLFAVPSTRRDGARNAVSVTRIEEKMGLHASPTCQLSFEGAEAELLGEEGAGLAAMFTMMNHARADVALQGVAHAARSHDIAESYAAERVQGRLADGSPARLAQHADVRRMLDRIDGLAVGARGVAHLALVEVEKASDPDLVEFLTPLAKILCTEAGIEASELAIQVLGGYGYLREYRLEQTYRDARITAIYEGANGIHARMLATRLIANRSADAFEAHVAAAAARFPGKGIDLLLQLWREARYHLRGSADPTPMAHDFARLSAYLLLQAVWAAVAASAEEHPDPERLLRLAEAEGATAMAFAPAHAARMGVGR
jgi:alkylation response protein AidB-like acyl-CoA dehydrogenase